jgi:glycerol-3-phosphate acyltransferase PlsX
MKRDLSADRFGGAPLLGLNGMVVKSHGSSSPEAVAHALRLTFRLLRMGRERFLSGAIGKINAIGS